MRNENEIKKSNDTLKKSLNSEVQGVVRDITDLIKKLRSINNINKQEQCINENDIDFLEDYNRFIDHDHKIEKDADIFRTMTIISNIDIELDIVSDSISNKIINATMKSLPAINNLIRKIKYGIKNISKKLWQSLLQMTNISQWSVAGKLGVNVLGLSGGVTLQITFGT